MGAGARHARRDRARRGVPRRSHRRRGVPRADRRSRTRTSASTLRPPKGEPLDLPARVDELPREAQEIKPHPHGVELGMLLTMLQDSPGKTREAGPRATTSRACAPAIADEICKLASVKPNTKATRRPRRRRSIASTRRSAQVKVMAPPATSVVPIGEELLIEGLKRRFQGRVLRLDHAPAVRLPRQPVRRRGRPRVRRRPAGRRARGDHALREPRPAAVPAEGVRDQRERLRHELEVVRAAAAEGRAAGRRRSRSSCTSRACGCRSRARRRKPSPTTTSSSTR